MEMNEIPEQAPVELPGEPGGITRRGVLELVFACFALVCAYFFTCIFPVAGRPLGFFVLAAVLLAGTFAAALLLGGAKPGLFTYGALVFALAAAFCRLLNGGDAFDLAPCFAAFGVAYLVFAVSLFDNHSKRLGGTFLLDIAKGFAYMFLSFARFFTSIFRPEGSRRSSKKLLPVIGGVVAAAILIVAVCSLLSYDAHFADLLPKIDLEDVFEIILKISFAVPIAALVFSLLLSSEKRMLPGLSTPETAERAGAKLHVLPLLLTALPIIGVLAVYALFFVSQWAYYVSAFTHVLPEGYSAAEYAREGFFNLLVVAVINAVLIVLVSVFTKNTGKAGETMRRVLTIALSLATLVLIATAISKMLLYIDRFDLTRQRLIATIFLAFLAIAFVAVIVSQLVRRVKALPVIIAAGLVILFLFFVLPVNRSIAKYNVDAYLSGKHKTIDEYYLQSEIGCAAAPELLRLYHEAEDPAVREKTESVLNAFRAEATDGALRWYELSIPLLQTRRLLVGKPLG
ncbi:MAG: DUF4173 domain-containing protein [Clostridia bacterium]|nr:DUF4173 domain-containing protein [Clostridia bacterium]